MKTILSLYLIYFVLALPFFCKAQQVTVSGTVLDGKTGKALQYASIFESTSKIGTITDRNGFFKLVLSDGELEIKVFDDGFKEFAKHLELKGDTSFIVKLVPEINSKRRVETNEGLQADSKTSNKDTDNRSVRKISR